MIRSALAWAALAAATLSGAHATQMPSRVMPGMPEATVELRAPHLIPRMAVQLALPEAKAQRAEEERPGGRQRVGTVRPLAKAAPVEEWSRIAGGHVARLTASSPGAAGLRVRLDVAAMTAPFEVRVQGGDGRVESVIVDPATGPEAWTPWTEGDTQLIEAFSIARPAPGAVSIGAILHFDLSPLAKAAGTCTVPTSCTTNDAVLDAAIAQRKNSVAKIMFVDGGSGFVCSATLINTERQEPFLLTANHCIDNAAAAGSVESWWFYEHTGCDTTASTVNPDSVRIQGGTQLVFGNYSVDATLLRMNRPPPAGAVFSGWNAARLSNGISVVSLSHPTGDTSRLALGATSREFRVVGRPQDMYGVRFSRGIIEGGSSGSGLFTLSGGALQLRGILSGSTVRNGGGMSCTNLNEDALYGRLDILHPQIAQYIGNTGRAPDDAPNRPQDLAGAAPGVPLDVGGPLALDNRRIDYAGDVDVYRVEVSAPAYLSAWTEGANLDTIGAILDSRGAGLEAEDDAQAGDNHFGITRRVPAGTYYVQVAHWEAAGTGTYNLRVRADRVDTNYTDLWWNPGEPGWGLNLAHQGNILFGALFTYDESGTPLWLVMSEGALQPDGSYSGALFRGTGPAFDAAWRPASLTQVGTMRIAFSGRNTGTLTYTFNGRQVTKFVTRTVLGTPPTCTWSAFDRSRAGNFQDLWSVPSQPGWGVTVAHQGGTTLFAALYTYDASGRDLWLVMSNGTRGVGNSFSGPLYRMSGPAFDASPWPGAVPTQVGTMSFTFTDGNTGTLTYSVNGTQVTKAIKRHVFSMPKTHCEN